MVRHLVALLAFAGWAPELPAQTAEQLDSSSVVVTSGIGEVSLTPDRALLRITVATRDSTASAAAHRNSDRLRRVMDSLNAMRLPVESIQVVAIAVRPNENLQRRELVGYEASAVVRVSLRTLDRLSAILDVALRAGATGLQDIEFHSERENAARRDALSRAYAEARSNALALAQAAGLQLGPLLRLNTQPDFSAARNFAMASMPFPMGYGQVPVTPRDILVAATVTASWRLRPAR